MGKPQRGLTPGEIELAKSVFGDAIDYNQVTIHQSKVPGIIESRFQDDATSVPTDGHNIYSPDKAYHDDFSKSDDKGKFIHLMAYVWQFQRGIETPEGVKKFLTDNMFHQDKIQAMMELKVDPAKSFKDYNIEQRAQLLQEAYEIREDRAHPKPPEPDDPDGKVMLERFKKYEAQNPNSFLVRFAKDAYGITKDAGGEYHIDPQKWAKAQTESKRIAASDKEREDNILKITAPFAADPHCIDPGRQPGKTATPAVRPAAPSRS